MVDKISLAGDLGSGKSTVSDILISALNAEYYSTGAIVRSIAEKRGMSVVELNHYMETHPEIDREIDDGLIALSDVDKLLIIDSRMAWHFTKGTFKVYLSTDIETSAARIMCAKRVGEGASSLEDAIASTKARRESEKKRYMEQYGVDIKDLTNYSLIVDTTYATPNEVAACITEAFENWKCDKSYKKVFVSAERLNYPDVEPDFDEVKRLSIKLELGEEIPAVRVFEENGEFYLDSGLESVMAYNFSDSPLIEAELVAGNAEGKEYVRMKNSL